MPETIYQDEKKLEALVIELLACMDKERGLSEDEITRFVNLVEMYEDRRALAELDRITGWDKEIDEIYQVDDKGRRWKSVKQHIVWTEWIKDRAIKIVSKYAT